MKATYILLTTLLILIPAALFSQDGHADTSFSSDGIVKTDLSGGGSDFAFALAQMQDGKILAAGRLDGGSSGSFPAIVQYNADGSLSLAFGGDGIVSRDVGSDFGVYTHVGAQADGKVIAAGPVGPFGSGILLVNRYLPNGDLDTSFGNNGDLIPFNSANESSAFVILDNDSFLIANPVSDGSSTVIHLKKFLPDGTLDASFGDNGTALVENGNQSNTIYAMEVMANGNIVMAARIQTTGYQNSLARLLPDGSKDSSFGTNGIAIITEFTDYDLQSMAVYDDGRIALLQNSYDVPTETELNRITRYTADGVFDSTFGTGGQGFIDPNKQFLGASTLLIQPDQRILLYGVLHDPLEGGGYTFIKRYHANGGTDSSFNLISITEEGEYFSEKMLLQDDGKLVCMGFSAWYNGSEDFIVERYNNTPLGVPEFESGRLSAIVSEFFNSTEMSYQINDTAGKVLMNGNLQSDHTEIDLSALQTGMYFLKAGNSTLRLVKE